MALIAEDDPFKDPSLSTLSAVPGSQLEASSTLAVGKDASLTLGTDSLIVLGNCLLSCQSSLSHNSMQMNPWWINSPGGIALALIVRLPSHRKESSNV